MCLREEKDEESEWERERDDSIRWHPNEQRKLISRFFFAFCCSLCSFRQQCELCEGKNNFFFEAIFERFATRRVNSRWQTVWKDDIFTTFLCTAPCVKCNSLIEFLYRPFAWREKYSPYFCAVESLSCFFFPPCSVHLHVYKWCWSFRLLSILLPFYAWSEKKT